MQELEQEQRRYSSPTIEIAMIKEDVLTLSDDPYIDDQYGDLFG
jgi:hypothetical protein